MSEAINYELFDLKYGNFWCIVSAKGLMGMFAKLARIITRLRARYYGLFYDIGNKCSFEKIWFRHPFNGWSGRKSVHIGNNVCLYRGTEFIMHDEHPITIGDNVNINRNCTINPNTTICKNACLAARVSLITATHDIGPSEKRCGNKTFFNPIVIEEGCWIGTGATILGGVTVKRGTVISAGAVVVKDCEPDSLYAGVPARKFMNYDKVLS